MPIENIEEGEIGLSVRNKLNRSINRVVDTIANLADISLNNGDMVQVLGYYVAGDGGGQVFIYRTTGRPTADGGFFINGPGADDYYEAIDQSVINARRFGAYGDGIENDGTKLNYCKDRALEYGLNLYIPKGVYIMNNPIADTDFFTASVALARERRGRIKIYGDGIYRTILKPPTNSNSIRFRNWHQLEICDLAFDYNGATNDFATPLNVLTAREVSIHDCLFFDSNPPMGQYTIGTGDGIETDFLWVNPNGGVRDENGVNQYLPSPNGTNMRRMLLPGRVSISAGDQTLTDADSFIGELAGDGTGKICYGNKEGRWVVLVQFETPPADGTPIVLTAGQVDQRQSIVVLDCYHVDIRDNILRDGGRIKCMRPGRVCVIENNFLFGINDNGITTVTIPGIAGEASYIAVINNTVLHAAAVGIFHYSDGGNYEIESRNDNYQCLGNRSLAAADAGRFYIPQFSRRSIIANNFFEIQQIDYNDTIYYGSDSGFSPAVTLVGENTLTNGDIIFANNVVGRSSLCAMSMGGLTNLIMTGNIIGEVNSPGRALRYIGRIARGHRITNNVFYGSQIVTYGGNPVQWIDCEFSDNLIHSSANRGNPFNPPIFDFGVYLFSGVTIKGNKIRLLTDGLGEKVRIAAMDAIPTWTVGETVARNRLRQHGGSYYTANTSGTTSGTGPGDDPIGWTLVTVPVSLVHIHDNDIGFQTDMDGVIHIGNGAALDSRSKIGPNIGRGCVSETYGTAIPTTGYWTRGSRHINTAAVNPGDTIGWYCTVSGLDGAAVWKPINNSNQAPTALDAGIDNTGDTDVTASVQAYVTANRYVIFSPGVYQIRGRITVPDNTHIIGEGATIFVNPTGAYDSAFYLNGDDCEIAGLKFLGTGETKDPGSYLGPAITIKGWRNTVRNCTFDDFALSSVGGGRVQVDDGGYQTLITENKFLYGNIGGVDISAARCGDTIITNNHSISRTDAFASIAGVVGKDDLREHPEHQESVIIYRQSHNVITGNIYVKANGSSVATKSAGSIADGNRLRHGIILHYGGGRSYSTISNNVIVNCGRHGIYIRGSNSPNIGEETTGPDIISNNIIRFCGGSDIYNSSIRVENMSSTQIIGNLLEYTGYTPDGNIRESGVFAKTIEVLTPTKDLMVKDNVINISNGQGIEISPTVSNSVGVYALENVSIDGNIVRGTASAGIHLIGRQQFNYRNISVTNNTVVLSEVDQLGIHIAVSPSEIDPVIVTGNSIYGTGSGNLQIGISHAITTAETDKHIKILSNKFHDLHVGTCAANINNDGTKGTETGVAYTGHRQVGTSIEIQNNYFVNCEKPIWGTSISGGLVFVDPNNRFLGTSPLPNTTASTTGNVVLGRVYAYNADGIPLVELFLTAIPTAVKEYYVGDRIINSAPTQGGVRGWICITAGTPGTWEAL